ncbi:MAG: hydroxypyruvate isomerase family protein [Bacteroidales bacterium]
MKRRNFIQNSAMAGVGAMTTIGTVGANANATQTEKMSNAAKFKMKYAPHFGMFNNSAGNDKLDQLQFMADNGFSALEHNGMLGESVEMQEKIATKMSNLNMEMGVFVGHNIAWNRPNLTSGKKDEQQKFLSEIKASIDVAKRVNARWMTVVLGTIDHRLKIGYQMANVVDALRRASELLEPHNITMVMEPLNFRNHPELFLTTINQAYEICIAVNSPSCKILDDLYHQQITEGDLIPNMDLAWDEIGYFQIGDNPGRNEPTTGEINYKNIFKHIHDKGFTGILGMEHGNAEKGKEGEQKLIDAYRYCDNF